MKKNLKFLLLAPFLTAILCESDDDICAVSAPENLILNVENITESYNVGEIINMNGELSSELSNNCSDEDDTEIIYDNDIFANGLFILKLTDQLENINAIVVQDYEVIYSEGSAISDNNCTDYIYFVPDLSENQLTYNYRLGISINVPGDYCIVNSLTSNFNVDQENNLEIFEPYNSLDNIIKFNSCEIEFTRSEMQNYYFLRVI